MQQIKLNPSDHGTRGMIVVTRAGQIVWRGPAKEVGNAVGADCWHVHTDDAPLIRAALEKRNIVVKVAA